MRARDKNLTVLSETEWLALYGLPDFDDFQRAEYFALTDDELALVYRRQSLPEQVLCLLQTGYFKAKQAFFSFPWEGSALQAEFKKEGKFIPIDYKKDWAVLRKIDDATGVKYTCK